MASLRLYTTSTFALINRPLRASGTKLADELRSSRHPLAITTAHIGKGLKKLRALNFRDIEEKDDGEYNAPKGLSECKSTLGSTLGSANHAAAAPCKLLSCCTVLGRFHHPRLNVHGSPDEWV